MSIIRTPKQETRICSHCRGTGRVEWRQHFALWTPDEWKSDYPRDMSGYDGPSDAYICTASPGGTIFEACKEGVEISTRLAGRPVAFEFNGAWVVCYMGNDPDHIAKVWWKKAYGKTYEESMRDR